MKPTRAVSAMCAVGEHSDCTMSGCECRCHEAASNFSVPDLMDFIERHADSIFVRDEVNGRITAVALSDLAASRALHYAFNWIRQRISAETSDRSDKSQENPPEPYCAECAAGHVVDVFPDGKRLHIHSGSATDCGIPSETKQMEPPPDGGAGK